MCQYAVATCLGLCPRCRKMLRQIVNNLLCSFRGTTERTRDALLGLAR